jgi:acyl dehydratase
MSLNIAAAHNDPGSTGSGRRLVYGGHTIGLALSHVTRALPNLVTVVAWRSCDHLAPVFEGDVLHSTIEVEATAPNLIDLRVRTRSDRPVLDWRLVGVTA